MLGVNISKIILLMDKYMAQGCSNSRTFKFKKCAK